MGKIFKLFSLNHIMNQLIYMKGEELVKKILEGERDFSKIELEEGFNFNTAKGYTEMQEFLKNYKNLESEPLNFNYSKLINIHARNIYFPFVQAIETNFFGSNLRNSNFQNSKLKSSNLRKTILRSLNGKKANLTKTNLTKTNLYRANLTEANLNHAKLYKANLCFAKLDCANLDYADLRNSNFDKTRLLEVSIKNAEIEGIKNIETSTGLNLSFLRS